MDKDRPKKGSNDEWKHPHDEISGDTQSLEHTLTEAEQQAQRVGLTGA